MPMRALGLRSLESEIENVAAPHMRMATVGTAPGEVLLMLDIRLLLWYSHGAKRFPPLFDRFAVASELVLRRVLVKSGTQLGRLSCKADAEMASTRLCPTADSLPYR
jgi:hypothetical protein